MGRTIDCPHCRHTYCCQGRCAPKLEIKVDEAMIVWLKAQKTEGSADGEATGFEHQGTVT